MINNELTIWKAVVADSALCATAADADAADVRAIAALRRRWSPDEVRVALELAAARRKAAAKFPDAGRIIADVPGTEQATSRLVAVHKAQRFARLHPTHIVDLCSGIGGDAMALARVAPTLAIDLSTLRTWMTKHNANCETMTADVTTLDLNNLIPESTTNHEPPLIHLDPSRRTERQSRHHRYEDYNPGPAFIERVLDTHADTAIKLGPGIEIQALPLDDTRELEFINERGTLVQAVLWSGQLAFHPGERTATKLPEDITLTGAPLLCPIDPRGEPRRYLLVPDPALERAGLLGTVAHNVNATELAPGLGILTSDEVPDTPWLTSYEVLAHMPWRDRYIRVWLNDHDAGIVTVKTRAKAIDPDHAQRDLRGRGTIPYTLFAIRLGNRRICVITRDKPPLPPGED